MNRRIRWRVLADALRDRHAVFGQDGRPIRRDRSATLHMGTMNKPNKLQAGDTVAFWNEEHPGIECEFLVLHVEAAYGAGYWHVIILPERCYEAVEFDDRKPKGG